MVVPARPAFLYVNRSLQNEAMSPIWGWWGQKNPFAFDLDYQPAPGVQRFLTGTAPMLSMIAMEEALTPLIEAGMDSLRAKSVLMTDYASYLTDHLLAALGFSLGSPRDSAKTRLAYQHPPCGRVSHQPRPDRRDERHP